MEYITRAVADSIVIRGASPLNRVQFKLSKIISRRLGPTRSRVTGKPENDRIEAGCWAFTGFTFQIADGLVTIRP
jgi:hypothetical protein